jgi:hypothetical protein
LTCITASDSRARGDGDRTSDAYGGEFGHFRSIGGELRKQVCLIQFTGASIQTVDISVLVNNVEVPDIQRQPMPFGELRWRIPNSVTAGFFAWVFNGRDCPS